MKKIILLLYTFLIITNVFGQNHFVGDWYQQMSQGKIPSFVSAIIPDKSDFVTTQEYNVKADLNQFNSIMKTKPDLINLLVPYGNRTYTLNLAKIDIIGDSFNLKTDKGKTKRSTGVQYRGIVDGNPTHVASLSLTYDDKSAYFSTDSGNFVMTRDKGKFIVYNEKNMQLPGVLLCETPYTDEDLTINTQLISGIGCKVVNVYMECDYAFFVSKGSSVTAVTNYVMGMFNEVAAIYANEDIAIKISGIFVWTTPDPYVNMSSSQTLTAFQANRGTNFNGNLAHFLSTRSPLGGIAYVNTLCNKAYAYGVSRISGTYNNFPTYSWTINVVTHELGHNLGSPHTQSCSWPGGAIDNCYTTEGGCPPGPAPIGGGTIMSYCHLTNYGINFNNGFGPQPGNLIRGKVQSAVCITPTNEATPPGGLTVTNTTANSATLSWTASPSTILYTIQYKLSSSSIWTEINVSSTSYMLTGLYSNSNYLWQVKTDCSVYMAGPSFITTTTTINCIAPTNIGESQITSTSALLNWTGPSNAYSYYILYRPIGQVGWSIKYASDNSITLLYLKPNTTHEWKMKTRCSNGYSSVYTVTRRFNTLP